MATLTLAIPDELKREMDSMPELNWSEIARAAIREKAMAYREFKAIAARSRLTPKDAKGIADSISQAIYKKYRRSSTQTSSSQR